MFAYTQIHQPGQVDTVLLILSITNTESYPAVAEKTGMMCKAEMRYGSCQG